MEKKRGHLQIGEPTHIVGLAFVISMVLLLWLSHDVRADILPGGTVRTSYLKANGYSGKNLDMNQDVTLIVDADFSAGKLYIATHNLTIEGNGNATLTLQELSTATSSVGGSITMKSGKVHINCTTQTSSFQAAVYCGKRITLNGGELTVTNKVRREGVHCNSLYISGGKLKIDMNHVINDTTTEHGTNGMKGVSVFGSGAAAFSMSGGELNIAVSGDNKNASMTGLNLSTNCKGVITGGKTYISTAYTSGTGSDIHGIFGYSGSSLSISGGSVYAAGYSAGIRSLPLEISENALVTAKATKASDDTAGIYVDKLTLSGHPIVTAEGGKIAISAVAIDPVPVTLVITEPKNGVISKLPSSSRYAVVSSVGAPARTAVIDYVDNPGRVTVNATPSELIKGTAATVKCSATMSGYAHDVGFSWSLTGHKSASTKIDADGVVHVAANETSDKLTVTAASKANSSISGKADITLIEKPGKEAAVQSGQGETKTENETGTEAFQPEKQKEQITIWKSPSSVKAKAKKNKVIVTWKKLKKNKKGKKLLGQIRSIQVQYSTDPNFEQNPVTRELGKKKAKVLLAGLQRQTIYFVRVRYVGNEGVSNWSKVKRVKTK